MTTKLIADRCFGICLQISDAEAKLYRYRRHRSMYRIFNKTERELDFMLNHEFLDGWDLMQPHVVMNLLLSIISIFHLILNHLLCGQEEEEPVDITDRFYQFRFVVKATDEKTLFNVREEVSTVLKFVEHLPYCVHICYCNTILS